MERISFCFLALLLVVLSFVPQSHQYGTVFVDTVVPVKQSFVNFDRTVSDIVNTTAVLVGGVRLSDPAGFNVTLTNPIDVITNGTLSLKGELGFILGNVNTTETSISANQTLNFMSQEFFSLFNNVRFNFSDEISFTSAAQIRAFADRVIDFEGVNGVVVSSERGNIGITSPEFLASSNIVTNIVSEDIRLASRTGFIDWTGEESIFISGDIVELYSAQSSEFLAYNNLVIYAEDAVQGFAANTLFSGLGDLSIGTNRTIDITTPNGFYLTARTMNFVSQDQITLNHREEDISSMTVLANNRVFIQALNSSLISDSIIARTFGSQKIIANQWRVEAEENINIGTEETKNVFFDAGFGVQSLNFTLSQRNTTFPFGAPPNSGDELRLTARNVNFTAAKQAIFQAQDDIRSLASSVIINTATNFNVTAGGDFNLYRTSSDLLTPNSGTLETTQGTVIGAAGDVISEAILLYVNTKTALVQAGGDLTLYSTNGFTIDDIVSPTTGTVTVSGANNYFKAGKATFLADSLTFNGGNTADASLSFALDVDIRANGYASIVTTRENTFESQQGDLVVDSVSTVITALQSGVTFSSAEDVYFDVYANLTVTSGGDIAFTNEGNYTEFEPVAEAPSLELTFDETITFSATNQHLFNINGTLLFDAGRNITAQATDDFAADAGSIVIVSYGSGIGSGIIANNTGVNGTISFNSTGFTGFTAGFLSFTADSFAIAGNSSGFTASEELNILIGDDINGNITGAFRANSDGHVFLEALAFTLTHNGTAPVAFAARDSLNITTDGQIGFVGANVDLRAGQFDLLTERIDIASNNWFVQAGNRVAIRALNATFYSIGGDLLETAPVIRHVSDEVVTFAGSAVSINGTELVELVSRQFIVQDFTNWELTSDEFFLYSEEFQAFIEFNVTGQLTLRAQNEVVLSSEQDLYFTSSTGGFFALATTNLTVLSDDSIYLAAQGSLLFANNQTFANGTSQNVVIQSGGSTRIGSFATGKATLASAADIAVDGGRLTFTSFGTNGTTLISNFGAMTFESEAGSFRLDSASSILLNATNELTTGSHYFLASNGVEMRTVDGGLFFDSQGVLEDGATAIEFVSSSTYGDIVFESEYGLLFLDALNTVDLNAGVDNTLHAAHGASFIADNRTSITATQGRFSAHGQRGVTINAGQALDNADVVFDSPQGYFHLTTADQITLTSTGVIPNNQPAILVSAQSDIRQVTGNTGNITALASGKLTFNATGDFYVNSTNNMVFNSTAGSLQLLAQDAILFQTLGGPLLFSTVTGSPDGDILLAAGGSGSLNFFAGNTTTFFARAEMVFRTATGGILATTLDGSLDIVAESSSSVARFLSAGGISVVSDSRTNLDDELTGIVLDSANNIVYGSANLPTTAVRFNARDHVVVGDTTRPLITFNAGGSAQQSGLTITSVGGISTRSEGVINAQIGQDYVVNTQFGIRSLSEGPTILQNTSPTGQFSLTSDQGNTRLYAGELLNIVSGDSILTSSEGALDLVSTGLQFTDGITFAAPKVDITSGTTQFQAKVVDADLTASFNLLTTGDATIQGAQDANSDFRFVAGAAFNGTSAGRVEISSTESQGGVLFNTKQAGSVISIVSDFQSDIGFVSADALNMVAGVYSLSASEVSIVAADRDGNSDGSLADIAIGAENNFSVLSGEDLQLLAQRNLLIETVDTTDDVGSPLQVTATGDLTVNAADEFTIQTVAGQQGSINFIASTSINVNGAFVSVQADRLLEVNTVGNYRLEGKQFEQRVDGASSVVANNIDRNDRFGVHFEVDSPTATTTFEALFGSVRFNSNAANVAITSNNLVLNTRGDGRMIGDAGFTYTNTANGDDSASFDAGSASVNMYGFTGIEYTSTGPTDGIIFSAGGIDSSSNFAVRFEADSVSPIIINSDDFFSETFDGAFLRGDTVDINTGAFIANGIEIELSSQLLTNITAPAISLFAKQDINSESGSFFINGESTLSFATTSGDIMIATHGGNATIDLYSSGSFDVSTVNINLATERRPSADLNLLSTLGRMEFTSSVPTTVVNGVQPNPYTLSILADSGSVRIAATNDDGDIYIITPTLDFEASGDLIVSSQLTSNTISGLSFINNDPATINAQSTIHFSDGRGPATQANTPDSLIQAPNVNFNAEGVHGVGGAINMDLTLGSFSANNQLTISAPQADAKVVFASEFGQTQITADTLTISLNSKMLIPYRNVINQACTTDQNFFYTDSQLFPQSGIEYDDSGYICVCDGGVLYCIELRENIPGQTLYPF